MYLMEKTIEPIPFTKDKPIMILAVTGAILAILNLILTVVKLGSHDFKVPVQYVVNDGSVLQTSNWYSLYSIALFSVVGAGMTIFLAYRLHRGNRLFAAGALVAYMVVGVVSLLVTWALLGLVGRV